MKSLKCNRTAWLAVPASTLFFLFFIVPFVTMCVLSFLKGNPGSTGRFIWTIANYERIASDEFFLEATIATFRIGFIVTAVSLVLGYPLAHWMARMQSRLGHALLLLAVLAPMLTGVVVRSFAWMTILQDQGVINSTLMTWGVIDRPIRLMYNEFGTLVAIIHIYIPFMVLTLNGVISKIDVRLEQAASSLGANWFRVFWEVTLPLSLPGILAGSLLVFALSISAYVTPVLLGGTDVLTLPMLIYQQVSASFNMGFAGALGVVLLCVSLLIIFYYNKMIFKFTSAEAQSHA